jgi:hypothetical protein
VVGGDGDALGAEEEREGAIALVILSLLPAGSETEAGWESGAEADLRQ